MRALLAIVMLGGMVACGGIGPAPDETPHGCVQAHMEVHDGVRYALCDRYAPSGGSHR